MLAKTLLWAQPSERAVQIRRNLAITKKYQSYSILRPNTRISYFPIRISTRITHPDLRSQSLQYDTELCPEAPTSPSSMLQKGNKTPQKRNNIQGSGNKSNIYRRQCQKDDNTDPYPEIYIQQHPPPKHTNNSQKDESFDLFYFPGSNKNPTILLNQMPSETIPHPK